MNEHTREPWNAVRHQIGAQAGEYPNPVRVADCYATERPPEEQQANAARIVACVNACAGMADPAAELASLRAVADAAREVLPCAPDNMRTVNLRAALDGGREEPSRPLCEVCNVAEGVNDMIPETGVHYACDACLVESESAWRERAANGGA